MMEWSTWFEPSGDKVERLFRKTLYKFDLNDERPVGSVVGSISSNGGWTLGPTS